MLGILYPSYCERKVIIFVGMKQATTYDSTGSDVLSLVPMLLGYMHTDGFFGQLILYFDQAPYL